MNDSHEPPPVQAPEARTVELASREPLLKISELVVRFPVRRTSPWRPAEVVHAVENVSFSVKPGQTVAIVGESGSGKTTIVRAIIGLASVTSGAIEFEGQNLVNLGGARLTAARRHLQAVFQEPWMSLNPRMRVEEVIAEPLLVHGVSRNMSQARSRVEELLELCEMPIGSGRRRVHSFSGGQQQRIALARALALEPKLIVADEPTSALDVSVQAQIIALMKSLQDRLGVAYLIVSHDLGVVRELADVVGVMYCGRMLELAYAEQLFSRPASPYTQALLAASPIPDPRAERARARVVLAGEVPNPVHPPAGCRFQTRCPMVEAICREEEPTLQEKAPGQVAACWFT